MNLVELLKEANDVCRSAKSIAEREGTETNWEAFNERVATALVHQHEEMHYHMCPTCNRWFSTPQGLGMHFKRGRCKSIIQK